METIQQTNDNTAPHRNTGTPHQTGWRWTRAQFKEALSLRATPPLYSQEGKGDDAIAYVKLFNPCGSWTWYVTEWDGADEAFGLGSGHYCEFGFVPLAELASCPGPLGIGIEIDVWFRPKTLHEIKKEIHES